MATRKPRRKKDLTTVVGDNVSNAATQVKEYAVQAREYAAQNPWVTVAASAAVAAVAWSARRYWMPIAAAAALDRFLPGDGGKLSIANLTQQLRSIKPSFLN